MLVSYMSRKSFFLKKKKAREKKSNRDGVGLLRAGQRAKEAANAEERDQKRLDRGRAISEEPMDKVVENNGARDLTNVVAEKEAADRRDDGKENGIDATVGPFDLDRPGEQWCISMGEKVW